MKGSDLYLNAMSWADHQALAAVMAQSASRWMVTYDRDDRVAALYTQLRRAEFSLAHTAAKPHVGLEFAVFSSQVQVANLDGLGKNGAFVS